MPQPEQTLQEMLDHWTEKKREAEEALVHIRALMKLAVGTKRKLETSKAPRKQLRKPKYKETGEDFIVEILMKEDHPLTVAQIHERMIQMGQKRTRQAIDAALRGLRESGRVSQLASMPGMSAKKLFKVRKSANPPLPPPAA